MGEIACSYPQCNTFAAAVEIKDAGDLKLNDSPDNYFNYILEPLLSDVTKLQTWNWQHNFVVGCS